MTFSVDVMQQHFGANDQDGQTGFVVDVPKQRQILLDRSSPLHQRFRALFCLRALGGEHAEAVDAICAAFDVESNGPRPSTDTVAMDTSATEASAMDTQATEASATGTTSTDTLSTDTPALDTPASGSAQTDSEEGSALLKHELAYVLGQMRSRLAIDKLSQVLADENENAMVRHEAGEALGAIGGESVLPILMSYSKHPVDVIRETCELAVAKILMEQTEEGSSSSTTAADYCSAGCCGQEVSKENGCSVSVQVNECCTTSTDSCCSTDSKPSVSAAATIVNADISFDSEDPAPALKQRLSIPQLQAMLMNQELPLFERYRAMFSLRNRASKDAVLALCTGLKEPKSALFRHEIAYVLGQLQHPASVPALLEALAREDDVDMVRHECAEALGSIASPEAMQALENYQRNVKTPRVVRESCDVALDMAAYENSTELHF